MDGEAYQYLVVSVDDRTSDQQSESDVKNNLLSKFLLPKVAVTGNNNSKSITEEDKKDFTGTIYLNTSKVLNPESGDDDMTYENMAEIIQFTTLTGRRTNFATTIGNANLYEVQDKITTKEDPFGSDPNPNSGSIEFMTSMIEPDTSATETVTLIPPTGLMRSRRAIVNLVEVTKTGVKVVSTIGLVIAVVAIIVITSLFAIRKYQKRRIK